MENTYSIEFYGYTFHLCNEFSHFKDIKISDEDVEIFSKSKTKKFMLSMMSGCGIDIEQFNKLKRNDLEKIYAKFYILKGAEDHSAIMTYKS